MAIRLLLSSLVIAAAGCGSVSNALAVKAGSAAPPPAPKLRKSRSGNTAANANNAVVKSSNGGGNVKMYMVSDIHYDPFYGTPQAVGTCTDAFSPQYGTITCDGNLPLITSAFNDVFTQAQSDSDSIFLLLGDILRHEIEAFADNSTSNYYQQYKVPFQIAQQVTTTIAEMITSGFSSIQNAIPHPNLLGAFGNNDAIPHFFFSSMEDDAALVNFTQAFLAQGLISQSEQNVWKKCGYFSRLVNSTSSQSGPTTPALFLNINSVFYSDKTNINLNGTIEDPCGQFAWMQDELDSARANGYPAIIIGHVVPIAKKWLDPYIATYIDLLQAYNDVITAQFFSHTHMFTFVALTDDDSTAPVFDIPSISPVDGNNPSYVAVSFDANWEVNEIHQRYLSEDQTQWVDGPVFGSDFGLPSPITTSSLYDYASSLMPLDKKDDAWQQFLAYYEGGFISTTMDYGNSKKLKVICEMICTTEADLEACRGE